MVDQRPVVLVVDDDPLARELTVRALMSENTVHEADSVAAAIEVLEKELVDVVVLDVMMPGISGLDGCKVLKATVNRFLPVVMLTALQGQEQRNLGLAVGADDYMSKPVDRRELQLRIATFARSSQQDRVIHSQMEEIQELAALKDDLVEVLVHDLRNPLSAVMSTFSLINSTGLITDPEDLKDLQMGMAASRRISALLDELLQVRLLEEGKLIPRRLPTSIEAVVRDAIATLKPGAVERGVIVDFESPHADTTMNVDASLLQRAIENLLSNAVKYTRQRVDVRVGQSAGMVEVTVADRGPGIPELLRPQMFEKFGSIEASRGNQRRGIGLGLYMVRLVAAAHGGKVSVEAREGGGSLFRLALNRPN